jgi:hypothetical protein
VAKKSGGLVNMKREIAALRLTAGLIAALGPVVFGGAPASAQDYVENVPQAVHWYMPQSWVTPPQTGPKFRPLPGQYGHNYRNRTYGSFSRNCFGDCLDLPGMVRTGGYHVILRRPKVVIFDPREFRVAPRAKYLSRQAQQPAATLRAAKPARSAVVSVRAVSKPAKRLQPSFTIQNGVRIFRPFQSATPG